MRFQITKTEECTLLASSPSFTRRIDECDEPIREAAVVKALATLSPKARKRVIGPWTSEGQATKDAVRAAGYDPDDVGAAEVIRQLCGELKAVHSVCDRYDGKMNRGETASRRVALAMRTLDENHQAANRLRDNTFKTRDAERQRADDNQAAAERDGFASAEGEVIRIMRECGFTTIPGRVFTSLREVLETKGAERLAQTEHRVEELERELEAAQRLADLLRKRVSGVERLREALAPFAEREEQARVGDSFDRAATGLGLPREHFVRARDVLEETK